MTTSSTWEPDASDADGGSDGGATELLTVGQALVRFLIAQRVERDGRAGPFFGGALGIFGHGNVAGVGQALLQYQDQIRLYQGRNEQGMAHIATGYAKMRNRLGAMACTTSIGPGALNMVTAAATATVNHLPVLLLPSDIFATRRSGSVLQQIETPWSLDVSANDAFRPVSRYWDRVNRPEQLPPALIQAMRVLTSPADTGAVTLALPQDVQAEAWHFPRSLFAERTWHIARPRPDRAVVDAAARAIRQARRPVIIAGGGVIYSEATELLRRLADETGIPVGVTQAGKASIAWDHPLALGALGASGSAHANRIANRADVVIGIGTRYTDFTTASNTLFQEPGVTFVNLNVGGLDAQKLAGIPVTGDAREAIGDLLAALADWHVPDSYRQECAEAATAWRSEVDRLVAVDGHDGPLSQAEAIGLVNAAAGPGDVVVNAAGSMPGDLHRLWRPGSPLGYHMEYGFSCMGYEVAGALGAKLADPARAVFALVGDGSWLMLSQEIMTAVQENLKLTVVLVDNFGYGSIAALSQNLGSQGFATRFDYRGEDGRYTGQRVGIDLAANARSLGAEVFEASSADELRKALEAAAASPRTCVIYVRVDSEARFGGSGAWWDVPVAQVSGLASTAEAYETYRDASRQQRPYL